MNRFSFAAGPLNGKWMGTLDPSGFTAETMDGFPLKWMGTLEPNG